MQTITAERSAGVLHTPAVRPTVCEDVLIVIPAEVRLNYLEAAMNKINKTSDSLLNLLYEAGSGINQITSEEAPFDFELLDPAGPNKEVIQSTVNNLNENLFIIVKDIYGRRIRLIKGKDGNPVRLILKLIHKKQVWKTRNI